VSLGSSLGPNLHTPSLQVHVICLVFSHHKMRQIESKHPTNTKAPCSTVKTAIEEKKKKQCYLQGCAI
jgi:hypothetical protein